MAEYTFLVGTYGTPEDESILCYTVDFEKGTFGKRFFCKGLENPSYLLTGPDGRKLYAVEELNPEGRIAELEIEQTGLRLKRRYAAHGADPCHLALSPDAKRLFVADYSSGSLSVFHLNKNGILSDLPDVIQHTGCGKHPVRQTEPHVHYSQCVDGQLYVSDLGLDQVFRYRLEDMGEASPPIQLPAGAGCRHLCFHPIRHDWMYALGELDANVYVFSLTPDSSVLRQVCPSLPADFVGENISAAIKITADGKLLFASNRGHDSISSFRILPDGQLELAGTAKTGGCAPRDFGIFDHYLIAANQDSNMLTALQFDPDTGTMQQIPGLCETIHQPVCILRMD